jgi:hypothetical protein
MNNAIFVEGYIMKVFSSILIFTLLSSCGSQYKRPESFSDKMQRYKPHSTNPNVVPSLPLSFKEQPIPNNSNNRMPASSADGGVSWDKVVVPGSNKKLYFLTLLEQYEVLRVSSNRKETKTLNHCPSFHSAWVEYKNDHTQSLVSKMSFKNRYRDLKDKNDIFYFPELGLPLDEKSDQPIVFDHIQDEKNMTIALNKAISTHINKTYKELAELCETGSSDNYYIYENLTTQISRRPELFVQTTKSAHTLLKSSIFFNMALLNSFDKPLSRGPASSTGSAHAQYSLKVLKKLGVPWMNQFLRDMNQYKNN